ncbi:uroporphyrinogen-III synthase [Staphylococcus argenteus]|uniref:uroporphyrinogen-III synthase n=1 Tax=Staphylococcus argenteus TaxID=985002 RepID=UPI001FBAF1BC|nr:uroporphyrinogen-III synthase [Staphylococcus argenteus]GJF44186.1 uroporphyrinogen-III synthase [Staphylococcus argenteus]GJF55164.1 uroporphyrinogen-III synthase [Staphylococcus argenteus]GJF59955.1 uroporphyrinogen-III synthase [Staphylococcus argenteus]GJF72099.1 uroporphyrinogen-III synthase [Staphylococcus argenteus]GJF85961.1 uroporphyrinogen-III synthase [Staphylococcus argenteus]
MKPVVVMTQTNDVQSDLVTIIHKPFIEIKPLAFDLNLLDQHYDWLIFSSKNAVKYFYKYLKSLNVDYIAVIGVKTAQYCESLGIHVDYMPDDFSQEGFLEAFNKINKKILIPSSELARPLLSTSLSKKNEVVKLDLYTSLPNKRNIQDVKEMIQHQHIDALTFSSSSAVRYYFNEGFVPKFHHYYAIGEQTARTIKANKQPVTIADTQTLESLIQKILESRG